MMTSSSSSQYITDYTPTTAEPGKSPLALLAKTCETIGLPEGSMKKTLGSPHHEKKESSHQQKPKAPSPRSTPQSKEPTLTFPGLPKPQFPMGMPPMGFPFFNPMMAAHYPFPGAFPMAPMAQRMPICPFAMMRQPCANPACMTCPGSSNGVKNGGQMSAEMMAQFAAHPLFSMYAGAMMPTMTGMPTPTSYQALLAASAAATSAAAASTPTDFSKPSTSSASPKTSSESKKATSPVPTPKRQKTPAKFQCNWVDSDVACGKSFDEESELTNHVKKTHAPSPSSSSTSSEPSTSGGKAARSATSTPQRFNPYSKPGAMGPMMTPMGMNMTMNPLVLPFSLQAMYSNRLMPTVAHQ
ncbi:hypothetical protein B9Z55_012713 [Caenorhabditis nigoni]|uniref:C2H2-type domain-containing protein n=2 Tax=Caenorhabditis nigoni TaxID=1611254 RepID=A0A2G5TZ23_9PELO|nr:hypothetical protein B9Z55_012713 [Caenorhabditis nigoni]